MTLSAFRSSAPSNLNIVKLQYEDYENYLGDHRNIVVTVSSNGEEGTFIFEHDDWDELNHFWVFVKRTIEKWYGWASDVFEIELPE